jgi:Effector-associated domain 1
MATLTGDQLKRVIKALLDAYKNRPDLELLVFQVDNRSLDQISTSGDLTRDTRRLVMVATQERWIAQLLAEAADDRPVVGDLRALADELAPLAPSASANPWKARVINGVPLVDREPVRAAFKELDSTSGSRVLTVSGPATSGKSYTVNLATWRATESGDGQVWIDLSKLVDRSSGARLPVDPHRVAKSICDQMQVKDTSVLDGSGEQDARWNIAFCDRLQGYLRQQRRATGSTERWWIVLDEFNSVPVSQQANDLIKELATRVAGVLTDVRLILLGYAEPLQIGAGAVIRTEVDFITPTELEEYFVELNKSLALPAPASEIAAAIARVLQKVDPSDPLRMRVLGEQVAIETRKITLR